MKTTFQQKLGLVVFGLLLTFVLLEGVLRLGGWIFHLKQSQLNKTKGKENITILCIGESTTALGGVNSYPSQVQRMLNEQRPDIGFKLINKGLVSKTSRDILNQLQKNLDKYQPDIVVGMIGVNDYLIADEHKSIWHKLDVSLMNLRVYKLFKLIGEHMQAKADQKGEAQEEEIEGSVNPETSEYTEIEVIYQELQRTQLMYKATMLQAAQEGTDPSAKIAGLRMRQSFLAYQAGRVLADKQDYESAELMYHTSLDNHAGNFSSAYGLATIYRNQGEYLKAVVYFNKVLEFRPDYYAALRDLALTYSDAGKIREAYISFKALMQKDTPYLWDWRIMADWFKDNQFWEDAKDAYLILEDRNPKDPSVVQSLAEVYQKLDDQEKYQEYAKKAKKRQNKVNNYFHFTQNNYNEIANQVEKRGAHMIAMQYPLRDLKPLKVIFHTPEHITFIENKANFEHALLEGEFSDYFSDTFAGDFGHCTTKGNQLIAQNVARIILDNVLSKVVGSGSKPDR